MEKEHSGDRQLSDVQTILDTWALRAAKWLLHEKFHRKYEKTNNDINVSSWGWVHVVQTVDEQMGTCDLMLRFERPLSQKEEDSIKREILAAVISCLSNPFYYPKQDKNTGNIREFVEDLSRALQSAGWDGKSAGIVQDYRKREVSFKTERGKGRLGLLSFTVRVRNAPEDDDQALDSPTVMVETMLSSGVIKWFHAVFTETARYLCGDDKQSLDVWMGSEEFNKVQKRVTSKSSNGKMGMVGELKPEVDDWRTVLLFSGVQDESVWTQHILPAVLKNVYEYSQEQSMWWKAEPDKFMGGSNRNTYFLHGLGILSHTRIEKIMEMFREKVPHNNKEYPIAGKVKIAIPYVGTFILEWKRHGEKENTYLFRMACKIDQRNPLRETPMERKGLQDYMPAQRPSLPMKPLLKPETKPSPSEIMSSLPPRKLEKIEIPEHVRPPNDKRLSRQETMQLQKEQALQHQLEEEQIARARKARELQEARQRDAQVAEKQQQQGADKTKTSPTSKLDEDRAKAAESFSQQPGQTVASERKKVIFTAPRKPTGTTRPRPPQNSIPTPDANKFAFQPRLRSVRDPAATGCMMAVMMCCGQCGKLIF